MTHRAKCAMLFKELSGSTQRQEVAEYATKILHPDRGKRSEDLDRLQKKERKNEKNSKILLTIPTRCGKITQYGALAQLGAHNTGSVGVRGSNPLCSTRKKHTFVYQDNVCFFQRNKSLAGFVKCTLCVKYAPRVMCAAAREGMYFIHRYNPENADCIL